jgi:hypothetical protein
MYNGGSDNVVKKLGNTLISGLNLSIDKSIQTFGYTLKDHWTQINWNIIQNGKFNMVVLQEGGDWTYSQVPTNATQFYQYVKMWSDTIRKSGATPVLYMMWAWSTDVGANIKIVTDFQASRYDSASRLIKAKVIPIGRGYYKLRSDTSSVAKSINLFVDYQHSTPCATYFIGCIAFSALYNTSPVGNTYIGSDISTSTSITAVPTQAQATYMQNLAWQTWLEYGGNDGGRGYVNHHYK